MSIVKLLRRLAQAAAIRDESLVLETLALLDTDAKDVQQFIDDLPGTDANYVSDLVGSE